MTTQTAPRAVAVKPVTFPRVLTSEWLKFWSLRSTYWTLGATLVSMVLICLLLAFGASQSADAGFDTGLDGQTVIATSYIMAQLVVAVLGVLMITGEYSTGMIRSTFAAVPSRVPALVAKAIVIAVVAFVVGVLGVILSYVLTMPLLGDVGGAADLGDPVTLRIFWGTGLYLAAVGLFGLALGALLRHSAGALAAVLGILLLLPVIVQLAMSPLEWLRDAYPYLPTTAGERIVAVDSPGMEMQTAGLPPLLEPWAGLGVFAIYIAVALLAAAVLMRRRDA
ncbi:ABC transporter permease [Georgenia sp. 311]|uniref:ABC transporter permease n=1 Tax=Georgenia wutianyii TaxID=2585135 RepID=A0ABX5VIY0_9MICO|nr:MULTISPECIES: ABC transporter permease subunit [Georgenia]QDB78334.1 ABC transporter permease [Georgenia wutianyii]TNC20025.1 ABC transporter permease [Georgenia sp. 311]